LRAKVAEDPALPQLAMDGLEAGDGDGHGAAAARRVERARHLEAALRQEVAQEPGLAHRVAPDRLDADLLDQVVARPRRVERAPAACARETIPSTSWISPVLKRTCCVGTSSVRSSIAAASESPGGTTTISAPRSAAKPWWR